MSQKKIMLSLGKNQPPNGTEQKTIRPVIKNDMLVDEKKWKKMAWNSKMLFPRTKKAMIFEKSTIILAEGPRDERPP